MRSTTQTLAAALILFPLGTASAGRQPQQQRQPKQPTPQIVTIPVEGFNMKGGVVNVAEGDVSAELDGVPVRRLAPKDELTAGDAVRVGGGGRAEVLLNPGAYLRLSGGTEAAFLDLSRENSKVRITGGSAIVEVLEIPDISLTFGPSVPDEVLGVVYPPVTVVTPQGEFVLVRGGVYRVDAGAGGACDFRVFKGMAFVAGNRVREGMRVVVGNGTPAVMKFDKEAGDAFDGWSRERSSLLVKSNKSLKNTEWSRQLRRNRRNYFELKDDERSAVAREQLTVSALTGLVAIAEDASVFREEESEWVPLEQESSLEFGDRVRTGGEGRAEVLPYANCKLHLSGDAELEYLERPDGGTAVRLLKGSAIVTSKLEGHDRALLTLVAHQTRFEILREGTYRLNVLPDGRAELLVYEGKVRVAGAEIKEGKRAVFQEAGSTVSPIGKRSPDGFEVWSRQRAAALSISDAWTAYFLRVFRRERAYYGGMWFFDEAAGAYTFVPGVWDFRSPYGGQYSTKFRGSSYPNMRRPLFHMRQPVFR